MKREFRFSLILVDVNLAVSQRFRWSLIPEAPKFMKHFATESETFSRKTRFIANEVSCLDTRLSSIYWHVFFKKKILRRCNFMETSNLVSRDNILTFKGRVISKIFKLPLISEEEYSKYLQVFSFLFVTIRITWE